MELNIARPNIESSGQLEEQMFSIQDQGMIFDILRSKMYSNNILAICREISCNARDAHREVGKQDVPIEITLPNALEPFYKIKDFGPGISPDRMVNVFIKYTASTKRSDNLQTGGFGLGAKTPFAYSDVFTIETIVDGTKYSYTCFIDETRVGKLTLLATEPTTESNGTEIIIPVKASDFRLFIDWTERSTRYWDVRPIIKGVNNVQWYQHEVVLKGNKWSICKRKEAYNKAVRLIIDGIEYPLELDALGKYANAKLVDAMSGDLHLYFEVGELTLSANREQVYLDDLTKQKIKSRLDIILAEVKDKLYKKIASFDNLWDAHLFYNEEIETAFDDISIFGKLEWKGFPLAGYSMNIACDVLFFEKQNNYHSEKIRRYSTKSLTFKRNSLLALNDLPLKDPTPKHVKKFFDDNPKLGSVQVICPNDKITVEDLNAKIGLEHFKPNLLSSVTQATGRVRAVSTSRVLVFKFYGSSYNYGSGIGFKQVKYSDTENDKNTKLLVKLKKDNYGHGSRQAVSSKGSLISDMALNSVLSKFPDVSIYGVDIDVISDKKLKDDFADFVDFNTFIIDQMKSIQVDFVETKFASSESYYIQEYLVEFYKSHRKLIDDPDSLFLKQAKAHASLKIATESKNKELLSLYESIFGTITDDEIKSFKKLHPELDYASLDAKSGEKYPLLQHINSYHKRDVPEAIAQYVNLIDKI